MFNGSYSVNNSSSRFNGSYSVNNYNSLFNGAYNLSNYSSWFNAAYFSYVPEIIDLAAITKEPNKFIGILDGVEIPMRQFYIYRRQGFLTTIVAEIPSEFKDYALASLGKEFLIFWESENFNGEMANSLLQDVSYQFTEEKRLLKIHCFRARREVATRLFELNSIEAKEFNLDGSLRRVVCAPQPTISPEDTIKIDGIDYTVSTVRITADIKKTRMEITLG